jgi:hypothetical protein
MGSEAGEGGTSESRERAAREPRAPGLDEVLNELRDTGRATWQAGREAGTAFRILLTADIALARSAFGRTLAMTAIAIVFGASAWLLLMAAIVAWLSLGLGWAWSFSLLVTGSGSLIVTALACWIATRYFEYTRFQATRRQLARLGIGELSDVMPDAGSEESAEAVAKRLAGEKGKKKGLGVDVTPP